MNDNVTDESKPVGSTKMKSDYNYYIKYKCQSNSIYEEIKPIFDTTILKDFQIHLVLFYWTTLSHAFVYTLCLYNLHIAYIKYKGYTNKVCVSYNKYK